MEDSCRVSVENDLSPSSATEQDAQRPLTTMAMTVPRLNYDVLLAVLQQAEGNANIVSVMETCRTLQRAGAPLLLRHGVRIFHLVPLVSFCQFMLADKMRFQYLRSFMLFISDFPDNEKLGKLMSRVFRRAQQLEVLSLQDSEFLDRYPDVSDAITGLTKLKTLTISGTYCRTQDKLREMLMQLKSPVEDVEISFMNEDTFDDPGDAINLLAGVAPHVERLNVDFGHFCSRD